MGVKSSIGSFWKGLKCRAVMSVARPMGGIEDSRDGQSWFGSLEEGRVGWRGSVLAVKARRMCVKEAREQWDANY